MYWASLRGLSRPRPRQRCHALHPDRNPLYFSVASASQVVSGEPEAKLSRRRFSTVNPLAKSMSRLHLRCTDVPLAWTFVATALAGAILAPAGARSAAAQRPVLKRLSTGTTPTSPRLV